VYTGLLLEFPQGCMLERFIGIDESARDGPRALERFIAALDEQDLQILLIEPEYYAVNGDMGLPALCPVVHRSLRGIGVYLTLSIVYYIHFVKGRKYLLIDIKTVFDPISVAFMTDF